MSTTPLFAIDELPAASSQPEVFINTAIRILEAMAQLVIIDRDLTAPPGSPVDGDVYFIGGAGTGDWDDHDLELALYIGTAWHFIAPRQGWTAYIEDEDLHVSYSGNTAGDWDAL